MRNVFNQEIIDSVTDRLISVGNEIPSFESNDVFRMASYRQEDVWLAPEISRWVIRKGYGRYLMSGDFWTNAHWEDYLQWELASWK